MNTIERIRSNSRKNPKTIVLPEYDDPRVVEGFRIIQEQKLVNAILLSPDKIDPSLKEKFAQEYYEIRKAKGMDLEGARKMMSDTLYYAAMMTRNGLADGFVAGASHTTADTARAAIQCVGVNERLMIASSCFIMDLPDARYGEQGTFVYADCGVIPDPTSRQLACIAVEAAELMRKVLDSTPRVALLSYSTKGSAKGRSIDKISEAMGLLKELAPGLVADGELQADAAIVPEVARIKCADSPVAGKANVLVFPNLEAGNIAYKLTQRLGNARALGPLFLGLNKPCSDLSRGCSADDVADCAAVTSLRAA